jgi:hypothetical protein
MYDATLGGASGRRLSVKREKTLYICGHREGGITERRKFRHILRAIKIVPVVGDQIG